VVDVLQLTKLFTRLTTIDAFYKQMQSHH